MTKYIDNDINKGILVDWNLIRKDLKKLKISKDIYNPLRNNVENDNIFVELSERSVGKTTNWIIVGLLLYKRYGIQLQYIRQVESMIMNKNIKDLFSTIIKFDYISKIFDGKYNYIYYKSRRWTLCKIDENGTIIEEDTTNCMMCLDIEHSEVYKSSYNAPSGDLIIFDEFISKNYRQDEFVFFLDLVKTIQRERESLKIVMLANTIDIHSQYLHELEIYDVVEKMELGNYERYRTELGTNISIRLIEPSQILKENKSRSNLLYYGFKNPKLNSIRGGGWSIANCQRIDRKKEYEIIFNKLYISHNNKLLKCDIVNINEIGIAIYMHWVSYTYDDSIILTLDTIDDSRKQYKFGNSKIKKIIKYCYDNNLIYYANNDCHSFFLNYIKLCNITKC